MEAAAALRPEHPDGAWLVELAGVTGPDGVVPAAAAALGAAAAALASPQPAGSTTELIVRHLAGRSLVLVLDNCEHVIGEAATLADTLVGAVPGLRLIATSREPLGIPGEVLVPVGGLGPAAAAELFVDRARAVRPGFTADGPAGWRDRGHLPPGGRPAAGRGARRGPPPRAAAGHPGRTPGRPLPVAQPRRPHRPAPSADAPRGGGLEL